MKNNKTLYAVRCGLTTFAQDKKTGVITSVYVPVDSFQRKVVLFEPKEFLSNGVEYHASEPLIHPYKTINKLVVPYGFDDCLDDEVRIFNSNHGMTETFVFTTQKSKAEQLGKGEDPEANKFARRRDTSIDGRMVYDIDASEGTMKLRLVMSRR